MLASATRLAHQRELSQAPEVLGNWLEHAGEHPNAGTLLAAEHANRTAAEVCSFAFHAAGAAAVLRGDVLQRCFRDIHVASQHIVVGDEGFECAAQVFLGFEPHPMV